MPRILGIDGSLTGTGLCQIDIPYGGALPVILTATVRAPKPKPGDKSVLSRSRRIASVIAGIEGAIVGDEPRPDLIVLEELAYGAQGAAKSTLDWLFGRIVDLVRAYDIPLLLVNVAAVKQFATGKGNADKDTVMLSMAHRYGDRVTLNNNNEADALALAFIGARYLDHPVDTAPESHLKCMGKVALQ